MLPLCLVVSADPAYASALQGSLRSHGLKLYSVGDLAATRPTLGQWRFDAILCDDDGGAVESVNSTVRWLRREQRAPIVVLASPGRADASVEALEAGATELIDKESSPRLIALKLQRLMELAAEPDEAAESDAVVLGELRLDPRREAAFYADRALATHRRRIRAAAVARLPLRRLRPPPDDHAHPRAGWQPGRRAATQRRHARLPNPAQAPRSRGDVAGARDDPRPRLCAAPARRRHPGREAYKSAR